MPFSFAIRTRQAFPSAPSFPRWNPPERPRSQLCSSARPTPATRKRRASRCGPLRPRNGSAPPRRREVDSRHRSQAPRKRPDLRAQRLHESQKTGSNMGGPLFQRFGVLRGFQLDFIFFRQTYNRANRFVSDVTPCCVDRFKTTRHAVKE